MLRLQATRYSSSLLKPPFGRRRTIGALPDEMLSEIFKLVKSNECIPREWCRVLWVCHRWSTVGRATSLLWCDITIDRALVKSFIVASLEYSKNTLLTIGVNNPTASDILPLLNPHISRIRCLKIFGTLNYAKVDALITFLSHDFPCLETFEECYYPNGRYLIWQPGASAYPRLRNLILEGSVSIKVSPTTVFPALRTLTLSEGGNSSFTLESFTQFLSLHPHIEALELDWCNFALAAPFAARTFPPTIRRLSLSYCRPKFVKQFFTSFKHIPAHVCLFIHHRYSDKDETGIAKDIDTFAALMFPTPPQRHIHTLSHVTSVEINNGFQGAWDLSGHALPGDGHSLVEFTASYPRTATLPSSPPLHLAGITQIFDGALITDFRFTSTGAVSEAEWIALFDACPLLEHVAIEDFLPIYLDDAREGLFKALSKRPCDGGPCWPHLKRFTVKCGEGDLEASFIGLLPRALAVRAELGAKVDQLRLFCTSHRTPQYDESKIMNKLVSWFEKAKWRRLVNDARLDFRLTYT